MSYTKWVVQADGEAICQQGAMVARVVDNEFPERVTKRSKANAILIATAINACINLNPDNPLAIASSIEAMYKLLEVAEEQFEYHNLHPTIRIAMKRLLVIAKIKGK